MKTYIVTIQTVGYIMYEVKAADEDDARKKIEAGKGAVVEEGNGDYASDDWEFEEDEDA